MRKRKFIVWVGLPAAVVLLLVWPAGNWLQGRELWLGPGQRLDAIYLVAGERDQDRRIAGLAAWIRSQESGVGGQGAGDGGQGAQGSGGRATKILLGNERAPGPYLPDVGRHVNIGEWGARKILRAEPSLAGRLTMVPGEFRGTDSEMRALAGYLERHTGIQDLGIVTSPFHVRRVVQRLRAHRPAPPALHVAPVAACWRDRAPWTVLAELAKMARDKAGLSDAPLVSRSWYFRVLYRGGDIPPPSGRRRALDVAILALLAVLAYAWLGYPPIVAGLARRAAPGRPAADAAPPAAAPRRIAILVSAHDEEAHIAQRLGDLADCARGLAAGGAGAEILVGVDGSEDRTAAIARDWAARHAAIRVHEVRERRGKIRMLKDLVGLTDAEILILTDANTRFQPGAAERLLSHFGDARVGGVCGRLVLGEPEVRSQTSEVRSQEVEVSDQRGGGGQRTGDHLADTRHSTLDTQFPAPEARYWDWEAWLKERESRVDSCLGANGAIYAVRRKLFWEAIPDNTVVDDFVIGMKVREQGFRMLYDPDAVAEEELPQISHEWTRRVRIGAGDFQALALCRRCLLPRYGRFAWMFASHKVLRWFTPHLLLAVLALSAWEFLTPGHGLLAPGERILLRPLSSLVCLGGLCGLLLWAAGALARAAGWRGRRIAGPLHLCSHFLTMQAALFAGFLRFCGGGLTGHWARTPRRAAGNK